MTSSAVGNVDAAQHIDEHLDGASFSGLKRRCEQLNILTDFEPSIDDELAHIQKMRVGKQQKKKLHDALRQRVQRAIDRADGAACQHSTSSTLDPTDGPGGAVLLPTTPPLDAPVSLLAAVYVLTQTLLARTQRRCRNFRDIFTTYSGTCPFELDADERGAWGRDFFDKFLHPYGFTKPQDLPLHWPDCMADCTPKTCACSYPTRSRLYTSKMRLDHDVALDHATLQRRECDGQRRMCSRTYTSGSFDDWNSYFEPYFWMSRTLSACTIHWFLSGHEERLASDEYRLLRTSPHWNVKLHDVELLVDTPTLVMERRLASGDFTYPSAWGGRECFCPLTLGPPPEHSMTLTSDPKIPITISVTPGQWRADPLTRQSHTYMEYQRTWLLALDVCDSAPSNRVNYGSGYCFETVYVQRLKWELQESLERWRQCPDSLIRNQEKQEKEDKVNAFIAYCNEHGFSIV